MASNEESEAEGTTGDHEVSRRRSKELPPALNLRIMLIGRTGAGKSASGNTILGRPEFKVGITTQSVTKQCQMMCDNTRITVVDTPSLCGTGLSESSLMEKLVDCVTLTSPGPHAFILVTALGHITKEEKVIVEQIQNIFGEGTSTHTIVLFTHGDKLNDECIEEFIRMAGEDLQELLNLCNNHYHVFNNVSDDRQQVVELVNKIKQMSENGCRFYTNEMYEKVERTIQRREEELRQDYDRKLRDLKNQMQDKDEKTQNHIQNKKVTLRKKRSEVRDEAVNDSRQTHVFRFLKFKCAIM